MVGIIVREDDKSNAMVKEFYDFVDEYRKRFKLPTNEIVGVLICALCKEYFNAGGDVQNLKEEVGGIAELNYQEYLKFMKKWSN
jgi:hypothetical protein